MGGFALQALLLAAQAVAAAGGAPATAAPPAQPPEMVPCPGGGFPRISLADATARTRGWDGKGEDKPWSADFVEPVPRPSRHHLAYPHRAFYPDVPMTVFVVSLLDERGRVVDAFAECSGDAYFDQPAVDYAKRQRFSPGREHGKRVRTVVRVPLVFLPPGTP